MSTDTPAPDATSDDGQPLHQPLTSTAADHTDPPDTAAELERWKQIARKQEDRAKANASAAKELEQLRAASMNDTERAVAEARAATRIEVMRELGATRVADHVRLAAAGRPINVDALLQGMDPSRFMDDDGQPDTAAISKWVDHIAPPPDATTGPRVAQVPLGVRDTRTSAGTPAEEFARFINGQLQS